MHKYKAVTYYEAIGRDANMRKVAAETGLSVSQLTRTATMRFLQQLEEWDDAVHYQQAAHQPLPVPPPPNKLAPANNAD
mgnify:CR=1 FL=1